jgi:hypothetical protein
MGSATARALRALANDLLEIASYIATGDTIRERRPSIRMRIESLADDFGVHLDWDMSLHEFVQAVQAAETRRIEHRDNVLTDRAMGVDEAVEERAFRQRGVDRER